MGPGASNNMWKAEAKKVLDHLSAPLQNDLSRLGDKVAAMFRDQLTELHNGNEQEAGQMLSLMFGSNNANQKILLEAFAEVVGATAARKAVFLLSPKR